MNHRAGLEAVLCCLGAFAFVAFLCGLVALGTVAPVLVSCGFTVFLLALVYFAAAS